MSNIDTFISMLEKGNDNALLRYSLGNEYFKVGDFEQAIIHLEKAIEQNQSYSAAWKLYAKALSDNKQTEEAINAYTKGINVAEENGDKQAIKEMQVFLKRLIKN
jgi:Tfp pilus assembly protein PilF